MLSLALSLLAVVGPAPVDQAGVEPMPVEVRVEGIRGELRRNALGTLRIAREARAGRALSEAEVDRLHARAPEQIRRALEPFGFYHPEIEGELWVERGTWRVVYRVDRGTPVTVASMEVRLAGEGENDPALASAVGTARISPGTPFRHASYEQVKRRLQSVAVERGYLDAGFGERRVLVDPGQGTAAITLRLDTGPRYEFGEARFLDHDLDDEFLRSFLHFGPGDPAVTPDLLQLQNALQASGLFSAVEVELLRGEAVERRVPVAVRLTPRPRRRYDFGLGYGTDTGPRTVLGAEFGRLNRAGHSLEAELRASLVRNGLNARYLVPLPGTAGNRLAVTAGILDERTLDVRSTKGTLGVGWHRTRGSWRESWLLDLQRERSGEGGEVHTSNVVLPSAQWTRTEVDDPVHATRGYRFRVEVAGSHQAIASPVTFGRTSVSADGILSLWPRGRLLLRGEVGASRVEDVTKLPVSLRFYAGGDRSVRGYAYRSLAPRSDDGVPLGGAHLFKGSVEVEHLFWRDWGLAAFVDGGNAANAWPVTPRIGTGVGLRWLSPVGMIGVDLAVAVSESGNPLRIHVSVGGGL